MDEGQGKDGRGGGEGWTRGRGRMDEGRRRMNEGEEKGLRAREVTGEG